VILWITNLVIFVPMLFIIDTLAVQLWLCAVVLNR